MSRYLLCYPRRCVLWMCWSWCRCFFLDDKNGVGIVKSWSDGPGVDAFLLRRRWDCAAARAAKSARVEEEHFARGRYLLFGGNWDERRRSTASPGSLTLEENGASAAGLRFWTCGEGKRCGASLAANEANFERSQIYCETVRTQPGVQRSEIDNQIVQAGAYLWSGLHARLQIRTTRIACIQLPHTANRRNNVCDTIYEMYYRKKRKGPSTQPCGTPVRQNVIDDEALKSRYWEWRKKGGEGWAWKL